MNLIDLILKETSDAKVDACINKEIYSQATENLSNEFLFILKPEVFSQSKTNSSRKILELVFERLQHFNISVSNIRVLNAAYLDHYKVIARHYGVINAAATKFQAILNEEIRSNFKDIYSINISDAEVHGSLELKNSYPEITDDVLQKLWNTVEIKRLAGGVYAGKADYKGKPLYIVNGFHPPQIQHFIEANRVIVTMNLQADTDWQLARRQFIGSTYPEKADVGTLRRDIFDEHGKLGFDAASYVINSVHLSAGPLEALVELLRFNSEEQHNKQAEIKEFRFGALLSQNFSKEECSTILSNPAVTWEGKEISLFDLSEELNTQEALNVIKKSNF